MNGSLSLSIGEKGEREHYRIEVCKEQYGEASAKIVKLLNDSGSVIGQILIWEKEIFTYEWSAYLVKQLYKQTRKGWSNIEPTATERECDLMMLAVLLAGVPTYKKEFKFS